MDMIAEALPQELKQLLKQGWDAHRYDTSPITIASEESLALFLELYVPGHTQWGTFDPDTQKEALPSSKPVDVLIKEFREQECRLQVIMWRGKEYLLRDLRTATLTVLQNFPDPAVTYANRREPVWLREYHACSGEKIWRRHRNSMSEKLAHGESFREGAIRAIRQELSIDPAAQYLDKPYFFEMLQHPNVYIPTDARPNEPFIYAADVRRTPRFPGLLTRNEIGRFYWTMPPDYFKAEGYHEPKTNHYFEWVPVTQKD